ncbi:MAG: 50S ribosomal protein L24 [Gammaproteobacteria bacterium]|nr:50S ribosomal protein L24 [Gammaproteobacteria bacterium]|tara:strand:+ start:29616 stop:29933 length:318 start_codon:yes stop_codon:yes gene_type:complete
MNKFKKGDSVIVTAGKDKGKKGEIMKMIGADRMIISNVNLVKKHVKPNPNKKIDGGIMDREMSIHISNVSILNPLSKKQDKIGFKKLQDGKKVRIFKSNNEVIDV